MAVNYELWTKEAVVHVLRFGPNIRIDSVRKAMKNHHHVNRFQGSDSKLTTLQSSSLKSEKVTKLGIITM
jgi:hypothetical protein